MGDVPSRLIPPKSARASLGAAFAVAVILLVDGAFALNNLAPYLGLNYASAMTMYSGLRGGGDNHLFMSKIRRSEERGYVSIVHADAARDRGAPAVRLLQQLASREGEQRPLIHLNVVRYQASRACASAPGVRLELRLLTEAGRPIEVKDGCAEPAMRRYDVLSSYPPCKNLSCERVLAHWQEGVTQGR